MDIYLQIRSLARRGHRRLLATQQSSAVRCPGLGIACTHWHSTLNLRRSCRFLFRDAQDSTVPCLYRQ